MKTYISPLLRVHTITGAQLLANSIEINSTEKVENSSDIGFVKDNNSRGHHSVWNDDWSKQ